jgi:hypothetical protein
MSPHDVLGGAVIWSRIGRKKITKDTDNELQQFMTDSSQFKYRNASGSRCELQERLGCGIKVYSWP